MDSPELLQLDEQGMGAVRHARGRLVEIISDDPRLAAIESLGLGELESLLLDMIRLCVEGRMHAFLGDIDVPYPVYNFFAGFDENSLGPWDGASGTAEVTSPIAWELMGIPVRMPIGVPASGLTANSKWIRYFSRRGFNILTYKTVRSVETPPHRYPHWVFVGDGDPWLSLDDVTRVRGDLSVWPKDLERFSTANSFGVPSPDPEIWKKDVERSLKDLSDGQLLILSVMGSSEHYAGQDMVDDFVRVALLGAETGVLALEINLSCPNTVRAGKPGMGPPICSDPETSGRIIRAVREAVGPEMKLVAKLSCLEPAALRAVVAVIGEEVDAISAINTVQAPISRTDSDESPFVGTAEEPDREREAAGVSGSLIRELGLSTVASLRKLKQELTLDFDIIGMGGVTTVDDVDEYVSRGATAVQTATGACLYPELPQMLSKSSSTWQDLSVTLGPDELSRPAGGGRPTLGRIGRALSSGGLSLVLDRSSSGDGR